MDIFNSNTFCVCSEEEEEEDEEEEGGGNLRQHANSGDRSF